ncbi:acetyltransferase [Citrobacter braakii]|nr:acetyltransferase [Citrobacter braakii]
MKIVNAEKKHIPAIRDIYAHHVIHGTGSFETDPPDTREMQDRLEKIRSLGLPWVVALQEDKVIGIAISPATASVMPIAIPSKIRFILTRRHSVRGWEKRCYAM